MGTGLDFTKSDEVLLAAEIAKHLNVKDGKLHLGKTPITIALPGEKGRAGQPGSPPEHQWDGTKLRFKLPGGEWGKWVDLAGETGEPGETPIKGIHYRDGKDGVNGITPVKGKDYCDGKDGDPGMNGEDGEPGKNGKNAVGLAPAHRWLGTKLQFQNPNGSWGELVDLAGRKGEPGDDGRTPTKNVDYFDGKDGKPGKAAIIPEALDMVVLIDADLVLTDGQLQLKKRIGKIRIYPKG